MTAIKIWLQQIRAPFLILSVMLVVLGVGMADYSGVHHWPHTLLLLVGVVLTHIAVNLNNEISDFITGIDSNTEPTPFSGGSGMMQAGNTSVGMVRKVTAVVLFLCLGIGIYFCFNSGWILMLFIVIGGLSILFYTSHLARWMMGEFFAGLTLGSMVVLGVYFALTSELPAWTIAVSIPPGILTFLLLFLNEFPDMEADQKGGRRHLVISLGRKKASRVYIVIMMIMYLWIGLLPILFNLPLTVLFGLGTLPLALMASKITLVEYDNIPNLVPALGMNVGVVLLTDLLLAVGLYVG